MILDNQPDVEKAAWGGKIELNQVELVQRRVLGVIGRD